MSENKTQDTTIGLNQLGWDEFFEGEFSPLRDQGLIPGRIVRETHHLYDVHTASGRHPAQISGLFHYRAAVRADYPTIGDWVAMFESGGTFVIEKVLARKSAFSRKTAGREIDEQIIAANIDILFIVNALDGGRNFNLRGIERYIAMAAEGGARPVIVLNKSDLCPDREQALAGAVICGDVPVHLVSALTGEGLDELIEDCGAATVALTGPSGVGKSALINALLGEERIRTGAQRQTDLRGRHTTTHKELFFLRGGLMLIDTPGLRELGLWADKDDIDSAFTDISELAMGCRFKDCSHQGEPGCAVQKALAEGRIDRGRYENYLTMKGEISFLNSKADVRSRLERKVKEKRLSKIIKQFYI
ncbi:MAG: ribosome small subunit-dependent GTPase A [Deltaproteobacteria bacterium]|nr:ribosome small subunit-dependent GTPase A [Deltaproteobacteria bacterium]